MGQFLASGGQSIGASASVSPSNEYSGLISFRIDRFDLLAVQELARVFNITVQKHQFFGISHGIFFHPFVSAFISFISILWFSEYRSFLSLGRSIRGYCTSLL